ncbi:protein LURP-one-related 10-like [Papaver somniferum]|uniref:protein LURP-one-related 10-like n=1 Tax=Papaver somniferum TaxID=3469 RepID=UPI000E701623|nr:protein LURP-one-related 10-like [Papaver somniferum]
MNQPNNSSITVISPHFCTPDLYTAMKVKNVTQGNKLGVFDTNGNNIFKVTGNFLSLSRGMLVDAAGVPLVTLKNNSRWKVYRGDSSNSENLLFSVKTSTAILQFKADLHVFLASNTNEDVCDFKVERNYSGKTSSYVVYRGGSVIAEMHKEKTVQGKVLGKDTFSVTIHPNVDYAFIIALRVVLDEMEKADKGAKWGDGAGMGLEAASGAVMGMITA